MARLHLKQKAGKYAHHALSRCFFEILRQILISKLLVTLGHIKKSIDDQDRAKFIDKFFRRGRHNLDDTRFKSSLKKISWRVLASTDTLMIAWLLTGNLKTAGSIMSLEIFTKMFLYCVHERFRTQF